MVKRHRFVKEWALWFDRIVSLEKRCQSLLDWSNSTTDPSIPRFLILLLVRTSTTFAHPVRSIEFSNFEFRVS